jgi:hypothetical protein
MSEFIRNNRHRLIYCGKSSDVNSIVIGPVKTVNDPEQFVPLFTCKPRLGPGTSYSIGYSYPFNSMAFWPNCKRYTDGLSSYLANSLLNTFYHIGAGMDWFNESRAWSDLKLIGKSQWDSLCKGLAGGLANVNHDVWVSGVVSMIKYGMPPGSAAQLGWKYGLKHMQDILSTTRRVILEQISGSFNNGLQWCCEGDRHVYSDWFYLALVSPREVDRGPKPLGCPPNSNWIYGQQFSLLNGAESQFCVVIKEKYRLELMMNLWVYGSMGELPKGSIQLWESKGLKDHLQSDYKFYQSNIQSIVRNSLKSSVRVFDNLDAQLFDIAQPVLDSPEQIEEETKKLLKRQKQLSRLIANHNSVRIGLLVNPRSTHINL